MGPLKKHGETTACLVAHTEHCPHSSLHSGLERQMLSGKAKDKRERKLHVPGSSSPSPPSFSRAAGRWPAWPSGPAGRSSLPPASGT